MSKFKRLHTLNRYYKITRFYDFLRGTAIKGGGTLCAGVLAFVFIDYKFLDLGALLDKLVTNYSATSIFSVFFCSETIFGLIPPEIFIAWSAKMESSWLYLFVLASLSYLGGILAYAIGKLIFRIPRVRNYLENKIAVHIKNLRKWGGFFVVIGALLPLPHAVVSLTCGLISYSFTHYMAWALFRYVRFFIYGLVIFNVF